MDELTIDKIKMEFDIPDEIRDQKINNLFKINKKIIHDAKKFTHPKFGDEESLTKNYRRAK